jgi:D-serine deaminase-like pyridoxal phosphate-dependent protein
MARLGFVMSQIRDIEEAPAFASGPPLVCDEPPRPTSSSDEHGRLAVSAATNRLGLGDKIRLNSGHCDPTVNLYD